MLTGARFINTDTLLSLQITHAESHPSAQYQGAKGFSGSKEGLSVYGLFHSLARTPQGRFLLRQYFLRPSLNIDVINERLNTISVLLRPDNVDPFDQVAKCLNKIKNMRLLMLKLHKGTSSGSGKERGLSLSVWSSIHLFVFTALQMKDAMKELLGGDALAIRSKILESFDSMQLSAVGRSISEIIDFDASRLNNRTSVRAGVDEELDNEQRTYDGVDSLLSEVAAYVANNVPAELDCRINVIYYPQIGFLIATRLNEETGRGAFEGREDDPWERMFGTQTTVYYKNANMREMDQYIGDVYHRICGKSES